MAYNRQNYNGGGATNQQWDDQWDANDNYYPPTSRPLQTPNSPLQNSNSAYMHSNESYIAPQDIPRNISGEKGYRSSVWLKNTQAANSSSKRNAIIIALIILALIGGGVTAGVLVMKSKNNSGSEKSSTTSATSSNNSGQTSGVVNSDPSDPSVFDTDPQLHKSFWGMCYTPLNVQYPWCGGSQANVTEDIQILSQLTPRLRTYGSDCNQTEMILEAIAVTKVDMEVFLGIWIDSPVNETTYARQVNQTFDAIDKYGVDHVAGIIVGNEYILMEDPNVDNTKARTAATTLLVERMADVRSQVKSRGFTKSIPVGTADAGAEVTTALANGADFVMANIHAYFAGTKVEDAADWVYEFYEDQDLPLIQAATSSPQPTLYIAETGWPSGANETDYPGFEGAMWGVSQLQTFLDTYICAANTNGTGYFFFEAFDEPWKLAQFGGVEAFWGLFDSNKKLKDITLPNCVLS